jgi:hypothetical protein
MVHKPASLFFTQIEDLKAHYIGCVTGAGSVEAPCPGVALPDNVNDAIELCLQMRR